MAKWKRMKNENSKHHIGKHSSGRNVKMCSKTELGPTTKLCKPLPSNVATAFCENDHNRFKGDRASISHLSLSFSFCMLIWYIGPRKRSYHLHPHVSVSRRVKSDCIALDNLLLLRFQSHSRTKIWMSWQGRVSSSWNDRESVEPATNSSTQRSSKRGQNRFLRRSKWVLFRLNLSATFYTLFAETKAKSVTLCMTTNVRWQRMSTIAYSLFQKWQVEWIAICFWVLPVTTFLMFLFLLVLQLPFFLKRTLFLVNRH